ncbi:hypothetical protein D3C71_1726310 [compost metagenome]
MRGLDGGCAGLDVDRHEDDRVELLRDHRVELLLLDQCVVAAVEYGQFDFAALDGGMLFQRGRPDLHEFGIEAVGRRTDLELFLRDGRRREEGRGGSQGDHEFLHATPPYCGFRDLHGARIASWPPLGGQYLKGQRP